MKLFQSSLQTSLCIAALALLAPVMASAQQQTDSALADEMDLAMPFYEPGPIRRAPCSDDRPAPDAQGDWPEHGQAMAMMPPPSHHFAGMPLPMRLHGLQLSEAQNDKVFAILYAMEPAMREQMKLVRQSQDALAGLAGADDYSDARLNALTETSAKAMAAVMQMRILANHRIYAVLTPEQRKQLAARNASVRRPHKPDAIPPAPQRP